MSEPTTLNQQVVDAVAESTRSALAAADPGARAIASQMLGLAAGLAMQDAVTQQRQAYLLHNAAVTALVGALLDATPERATHLLEALREVRQTFAADYLSETLAELERLFVRATARQPLSPLEKAATTTPASGAPAPTPADTADSPPRPRRRSEAPAGQKAPAKATAAPVKRRPRRRSGTPEPPPAGG